MALGAPPKSSWNIQSAVFISESSHLHLQLRELMRPAGWTICESTALTSRAIELIHSNAANFVIIDDSINLPAYLQARHLMSDPATLCTPVVCFLLEIRKDDQSSLLKMGVDSVIEKPLTPSKFIPAFRQVFRAWEKEPFLSLRRATYLYLRGEQTKAVMAWAKLMQMPGLLHICAPAIAFHLRRSGKLKDAERVLLTALKRSPKELGTILALADLYLEAAMPNLAHRLLLGARSTYSKSLALLPDIIQAALMLGHVDDAIQSIDIMLKRGDIDELTLGFLGRLMFAEGREPEAERLIAANSGYLKRIQTSWLSADVAPASAPAPGPAMIAS